MSGLLLKTAFVATVSLGAVCGFYAGGTWVTQRHERAALAHSCGYLDRATLEFRYYTANHDAAIAEVSRAAQKVPDVKKFIPLPVKKPVTK